MFIRALPTFAALVSTTVAAFGQTSQSPDDDLNSLFAVFFILLILFFIPTYVAFYRNHPNRWLILVINATLGGTGIGWLGSLVWAFSAAHMSNEGSNGGESGLNLFANDPQQVTIVPSERDGQIKSPSVPPLKDKLGNDIVAQLGKLNALKQSGTIDEDEFLVLKRKLIGG